MNTQRTSSIIEPKIFFSGYTKFVIEMTTKKYRRILKTLYKTPSLYYFIMTHRPRLQLYLFGQKKIIALLWKKRVVQKKRHVEHDLIRQNTVLNFKILNYRTGQILNSCFPVSPRVHVLDFHV